MTLQLFAHPFSSYCWKVLIALRENDTPFTFRMLDADHPDNGAELVRRWPVARFPLLVDGDATIMEATSIIEYLAVHHPGPVPMIPTDPVAALPVRRFDRIFDNHVMTPTQTIVFDALRPEGARDAYGVEKARTALDTIYAWLDSALDAGPWAAGKAFSMADCAAAASLFYADWVQPIAPQHERLRAYRARLLARPRIARIVDEARPYRPYFPLGAPERD